MESNPGLIRNACGGHPVGNDMVSSSSSAWARFSLSCCYSDSLAMVDGDDDDDDDDNDENN